jgi:hypothetical protein
MLANNRDINSNLRPLFDLNPRVFRVKNSFMGEAADHLARLTSCAEIR